MLPTICKIGPVSIYSYGVMMACAVIVCTVLLSRDAHKQNISSDVIFDFMFWIVLSGILGSRIFFILLNLNYFIRFPSEILMVQNGGLAWQGGLIFGSLATAVYLKKKNLKILPTLDLFAPYIALGQSIGRVGCFLNGCCYGREVSWGIYFPVHQAHLHPTQLYSTGGLIVIFFILKWFRSRSQTAGETFVLYLILASLQRFFVEFIRADHHTYALGLSIFQMVCIGVLLAAVILRSRLKVNSKN